MTTSRITFGAMLAAVLGFAVPVAGQSAQPVPRNVQQDLQKLHADNQAEIETTRTALQRGQSQAVKDLAAQLHQDHRHMDAQLEQLAQQLGVNLEGNAYQGELQRLEGKAHRDLGGRQGGAFDRAYTSLMVQEHKSDVNDQLPRFIKDARNANLPQIAALLDETEATLKDHLLQSQRAQAHEQRQARTGTTGTGSAGEGTGAGAGGMRSGSGAGTGYGQDTGAGSMGTGAGTAPGPRYGGEGATGTSSSGVEDAPTRGVGPGATGTTGIDPRGGDSTTPPQR